MKQRFSQQSPIGLAEIGDRGVNRDSLAGHDAPARGGRLRALVVLGATLGAFAVAVVPANSQLFSYCGARVNSTTWCGNNSVNHSYHGQIVSVANEPSSTVMCERMLNNSTLAVRSPGPTCTYGGTSHGYCYTQAGLTTTQYQAEAAYSSGDNNGVVYGSAYYGTQDPNICVG